MFTRYLRAIFPHQKIDEYTADAWHDVIRDLTLKDATDAAVAVAKRQPFISPSEIIAETRRAHGGHPSDRTVREALTASAQRALGAATSPPTPEYLAAKQALTARREADPARAFSPEEIAARQAAESRAERETAGGREAG